MKQIHYCQRKLKQEYCQFIRKNPEAAINFCLPNQANITNKGKNIHIFTKGVPSSKRGFPPLVDIMSTRNII